MEDKAFELLTKMYGEFSEFRKDITDKVENNTKEIRTVGSQVTKLENDLKLMLKFYLIGTSKRTKSLEYWNPR